MQKNSDKWGRRARFAYTLKHKWAYLKVEKQLRGCITLNGLIHDVDKLLFVVLPEHWVQWIHVRIWDHHSKKLSLECCIQKIIDWECARMTKPDKPLNARDTCMKYYPDQSAAILPLIYFLEHRGLL